VEQLKAFFLKGFLYSLINGIQSQNVSGRITDEK